MSDEVRRTPGPEGDDEKWIVIEDPHQGPIDTFVFPVNWTEYEDTFPARYLESGLFDEVVGDHYEEQVDKDKYPDVTQVLDIGGGVKGTEVLRHFDGSEVYLLDPNVEEAPDWMKGKISWQEAIQHEFGLIVARGSINYLLPRVIERIPSMLAEEGVFLFNSFMRRTTAPRAGERPYVTKDGKKGTERWTYDEERKVILHELEPERDGTRALIRHSFFYYTVEDFISMLRPEGLDGLSFHFHGTSSLIGELRK
jgi:hypothetical protein